MSEVKHIVIYHEDIEVFRSRSEDAVVAFIAQWSAEGHDPDDLDVTRGEGIRCYVPSPEQIRRACRSIRREWSLDDWRERSGTSGEPFTVPFARKAVQ